MLEWELAYFLSVSNKYSNKFSRYFINIFYFTYYLLLKILNTSLIFFVSNYINPYLFQLLIHVYFPNMDSSTNRFVLNISGILRYWNNKISDLIYISYHWGCRRQKSPLLGEVLQILLTRVIRQYFVNIYILQDFDWKHVSSLLISTYLAYKLLWFMYKIANIHVHTIWVVSCREKKHKKDDYIYLISKYSQSLLKF